ncbi:MAG: formimidoylglutamate deiminase [Rhodospirillales bacterium]|nr:formimidoylglutamate deiminase [Rhodospirillales bacterium]
MTRLFFEQALVDGDWASDVRIEVSPAGDISSVTPRSSADDADHYAKIGLPGLTNAHSHAFQRAMAGLAEVKGASDDSFWTWRKVMYGFVARLTPDDLFAIAALAYGEMLEAGFTSVCEFQYLHHDPTGAPYGDIAAMTLAIGEAARLTGIAPTLLPVFYANSQFGGAAPTDGQRRFVTSPDQFARLLERCQAIAGTLPGASVGIAPHSLRAVTEDSLNQILALHPAGPVHIHIAEQQKEVDDCLAWSGQRPVDWLADHAPVDARWCLVHATHMTASEGRRLTRSGAVAGLCPITEANLGDGIFAAVEHLEGGGRIAIGSDSNVLISAAEELRLLEYGQRLRDQGRNRLAAPGRSTGHSLFAQAVSGGAQASGRKAGRLAAGYRADILSLDGDHPALVAKHRDGWLDGWIFAATGSAIRDVWVGGDHVVVNGHHRRRSEIRKNFATTLKRLLA